MAELMTKLGSRYKELPETEADTHGERETILGEGWKR